MGLGVGMAMMKGGGVYDVDIKYMNCSIPHDMLYKIFDCFAVSITNCGPITAWIANPERHTTVLHLIEKTRYIAIPAGMVRSQEDMRPLQMFHLASCKAAPSPP